MNFLHRLLARAGGETMRKIRFLTVPAVLFVIVLGIAPLAVAQTPTELEEFRRDLAKVLDDLDQHSATIRQNPLVRDALARSELKSAPPLAKAQRQLQQFTHEELALLYQAFAIHFPNWREAPQVAGRIADKIGGRQPRGEREGTVSPESIFPDNCQTAFDAAPSFTDLAVASGLALAAEAAAQIVPPVVNVPAVGVWAGLRALVIASETLNAIFDRCSGDQTDQTIQTAINNIQVSLKTNTTTILNNDNSNRTTIVNNDNANRDTILSSLTGAQTAIVNNSNAGGCDATPADR